MRIRNLYADADGQSHFRDIDGERRVLQAGEVTLVEDIRGKGHLSNVVAGRVRRSI